jgi:hypothetical protein
MSEDPNVPLIREELRTPRAAGIAGLVFAVTLGAVLVLLHLSIPRSASAPIDWINVPTRRTQVQVALNLIPFAGIAFLWFIGVIRSRLGNHEDKLFATVFLGSGLLFVAMLFSAAAVLSSLLTLSAKGTTVGHDSLQLLQTLTKALVGSFGARMAAVFTASVTSIGLKTQVLPRWLVVTGMVTAVALLISPPLSAWVQMLFPVWVLAVSLHLLREPEPKPSRG